MANQFIFANFFTSELIASIGVGDTTIQIPPSDSQKLQNFSSGFYLPLTLWDGQNTPEIVYCTVNPQNGTLTVIRGQENTSPFGWSAGTQVISVISAAVLNAALAAYNSGQVLIANYLPLSGGTLTGMLTLAAPPTLPLQAASKSYVDALGTGPFLPLVGGTLSGNLALSNNARIVGLLAPSTGSEPATKTYADAITTSLTNFMADRSGKLLTTGTGAAYALATTQGYSGGLSDGVQLSFRLHATNQVSPTLAVDGTAAVNLRVQSGVNLSPAYFGIGQIVTATYRAAGPEWIIAESFPILESLATTGGPSAYSLTTGMSLSILQDGIELLVQFNATNTNVVTLNVDGLGAVPVRPASGIDFAAGQVPQYAGMLLRYNSATTEWILEGAPNTAPLLTKQMAWGGGPVNYQLVASTAGNILTVALKDSSGNDPTAASPVQIPFADNTATGGDPAWASATAANSIATIVGATLGASNNVPFRYWICAFNNAGTIVLALINCSTLSPAQIFPLNDAVPQSTTGMTAGSTAAGTFYTPNGVTLTSKSFRIIGYLEYNAGLVTAGTFNTNPTALRLFESGVKKPGDIVQVVSPATSTASVSITASTAPTAVTLNPSVSISPTSTINPVRVRCVGCLEDASISGGNSTGNVQLGRNSNANLFGTVATLFTSNSNASQIQVQAPVTLIGIDNPQTTSSVTYTPFGWRTGGNCTWNGAAPGSSYIEAEELMG